MEPTSMAVAQDWNLPVSSHPFTGGINEESSILNSIMQCNSGR